MANKEKIDYLLLDIRELENKVASMRDAEIYPVSFFSQSYEMAHKILTDLHSLETEQLEMLSRQMEEHRLRIHSIPFMQASPQTIPVTKEEVKEAVGIEEKEPEEKEEQIDKEEIIDKIGHIEEPTTVQKNDLESGQVSLNEILERKILSDFRKAFSLNDRFRFRRELFGGDESRMNKAITDLNNINSFEESMTYLHQELQWNIEDEAVADFLKLIEKRFV